MREYITNKLQEKGFTLENDIFTKEATQQAPGRQMVINGQRFDEPGQEQKFKYKVELLGTGYIEEPHEDIEWISWEIYREDVLIQGYAEGLYEDDKNKFDEICSELGI